MGIIVTRHGQTAWNATGRLQGKSDIELNNVGRKQAEEAGKLILNEHIDLIIASPLKRAKETAQIINKNFNVTIIEDERLMERDYGQNEGLTKAERKKLKKKHPEVDEIWNYNKNVAVYDIETMQHLCNRVYEFLDEITEKYKDKNILIVTHNGVYRCIKCYFTKFPLEKFVDRNSVKGLENCEVVKFHI